MKFPQPETCLKCNIRSCKSTKATTLDICEYNVAHYNDGKNILKKEALTPLRFIARNLRHEINPILMKIVRELNELDPYLSSEALDLTSPPGRIYATTIILDHFIQMMTGVYEFKASEKIVNTLYTTKSLDSILRKWFVLFSILRSSENGVLSTNIGIKKSISISFASDIIEYIFSILMDNVWKFATNNSEVVIEGTAVDENLYDVTIINKSTPIDNNINIFARGTKNNPETRGFGFGLFWLTILIDHYNKVGQFYSTPLSVDHQQSLHQNGTADQLFAIRNIRIQH